MTQKVIKIGTSIGATFPQEINRKVGLKHGDRIKVSPTPNNKGYVIERAEEDAVMHPDEKLAKLTLNFINRYRKDLEALADK